MPNRVIHDSSRTSPSLAQLSDLAERTFWRLITVFDDFGRYHGTDLALLAAAYPVPPHDLTPQRFAEALHELESGDLLRRYEAGGRTYVYSPTWTKYQRLRARDSKFPEPQCNQGGGHRAVIPPRAAAGVGVGVGVGNGDGDAVVSRDPDEPPGPGLQRPSSPPVYVQNCPPCAETLRLLNLLCVTTFNAPAEAGLWMHQAHEQHGLKTVLATVRRKHAQLAGDPRMRRFMAPAVLFKPKNWDVTVNDVEPVDSDELPRLRV